MKVRDTKPGKSSGKVLQRRTYPTHPLTPPKPLSTPVLVLLRDGREVGRRWTRKVPSPLLQLCGWSHKEAPLGAKDAGIDGSNLADSLRLARTWPLLLFFKPRIVLLLQLYLDTGLISADGEGRGCCFCCFWSTGAQVAARESVTSKRKGTKRCVWLAADPRQWSWTTRFTSYVQK